jgi:signal recognition particle GTPase
MLKETLLTTQFHLKDLIADLDQITYISPLSKIHVKLPGKFWQDKLKEMKEELTRF